MLATPSTRRYSSTWPPRETDVARDGEDFGDVNWEALRCRLVVTVLALDSEAGFRSHKIETSLPKDLNWEGRLKDREIGRGGSETTTPHKLTLEQVLDLLPPPGVAASIEAADVATGFVRDALLDPSLALLPPGLRRAAPTSARVWAAEGEWHRIVEALRAPCMIAAIPASEIDRRDGAPLLNGAFGAPKVHDAPVKCSDGELRPVLRPIANQTPSNARQECIVGGAPEMPKMGQLNGLALTESEDLLRNGADRKDGGATRICLRVIGMGWISAAGATTHLHGNMLRWSSLVPRGLSPSCEITRRRRLPLEKLRGTVPALLSDARACYEAAGSPGSPGKDLHRAVRATTLGYLAEVASLALWVLGKKRASVRLIRIPLGRWVRVHCFCRPPAASFARARRWLGDPRCGGRFSVNVAEVLLMCLALSGLCAADMRLEVDHLATASHAAEAAGAVVYSTALPGRGRALAARRQRPANAAAEGGNALITVFDGIGGGRRAFGVLGLAPVVHFSFEVGPKAVRVARRCYPGTQHLGDATEAGAPSSAGLLPTRGRIARALVIGGFPCQVFASLDVDRRGSSDPRASLIDCMVELVGGLRTATP
ncbi:unnamed protein product [Prorocentrum cordatum]|uniref:DNA (cytosine-5-)-methyltransferase n=1 Tax=Prorocentrum cordatum TaxID=2364126 RepID=A0ABN9VZL4_9DINO|nr:unnamed protein product [Polarella glacialis]